VAVRFPAEINKDVIIRLRRLEGQVRGLQRLVEDGSECRDIVTQLAAAKGALDRIGFKLMAAALADADADADTSELERLFLKLS
jgi:DNA-binding FrmR family transcriptional regulator